MSEISNYIPIGRTLFEHRFWCEERTYSRFEAWLDLIQMARFEDGKKYVGNKVLLIKRGQVHATYRFLSVRWGWSSKKVNGFFDLLISDEMISKETQKETRRKREGNAKETNIKNDKKENNDKDFNPPLIPPEGEKEKSNFEKFNIWLKGNCPTVCRMKSQMSESEFTQLRQKYSADQMMELFLDMENTFALAA